MKLTRLFPIILVSISMILFSACSTAGFNLGAPAADILSAQTRTNPAQATNPQTTGDVQALETAYETIYQNVNPSVVTIMISSAVSGKAARWRPGKPGPDGACRRRFRLHLGYRGSHRDQQPCGFRRGQDHRYLL